MSAGEATGCGLCCSRSLRRWLARPEDSDTDVKKKAMFFWANFSGFVLGILTLTPFYDDAPWLLRPACLCYSAFIAVILMVLLWTRRLTLGLIGADVVVYLALVSLVDIIGMGVGMRLWSAFVILCDVLLVLEVPNWMTLTVVGYVLVHLAVCEVELGFRVGLLDVDGLYYSAEIHRSKTDCAKPPCSTNSFKFRAYGMAAIVFCLDYYLTRGFASALRKEKQAMEDSIALSQAVAHCLARFDLDAAREQLAKTGALPDELYTSYQILLNNLASYRPYLPQSVLPGGEDSDAGDEAKSAASDSGGSTGGGDPPRRASAASAHSSTSSSLSPLRPPAQRAPAVALNFGLKITRCTLLHVSARLDAAVALDNSECLLDFVTLHQAYVSVVVAAAAECRGIVDAFTGGAITASFNASRMCAQHTTSAANAVAMMTPQLEKVLGDHGAWAGGVTSGPAYVGVLGTPSLRRPSVVGVLPQALERVVRVAEHANRRWLCNGTFYADQNASCEMRVWLHWVRFAADEDGTDMLLYELLSGPSDSQGDAADPSPKARDTEWMYTMGNAGKHWEHFNAAGQAFLRGSLADAQGYLCQNDVAAATVGAFEDAAAAAEVVSFYPRSTRARMSWGGCPDGLMLDQGR